MPDIDGLAYDYDLLSFEDRDLLDEEHALSTDRALEEITGVIARPGTRR